MTIYVIYNLKLHILYASFVQLKYFYHIFQDLNFFYSIFKANIVYVIYNIISIKI